MSLTGNHPTAAATPTPPPTDHTSAQRCLWVRRLGVAGFLFFLAKGLAWLAVPVLLAYGCGRAA